MATLSLVLPAFTTGHPGKEFTSSQLAFAAIATLLVYLLFVFTQTVRHRDFFLPIAQRAKSACSRTRATRIRPAGGRR